MLVTNGNKILLFPQDLDKLNQLCVDLKKRAKDVLSVGKAKFEVKEDENNHYMYIANIQGFTYEELRQICMPDLDLKFRAIGTERVQMPTTKLKTIRHQFTEEEKAKLADELCDKQYDKEKLEDEKKATNKKFAQEIEVLENIISGNAKLHRQGYELQEREANLHLDFENKCRVYTDVNNDDVLLTEPMEPQDFQMQIEFGDDGKAIEPEEILDDPFMDKEDDLEIVE